MQRGALMWSIARAGIVAAFLITCATYAEPGRGFTAFLGLPAGKHQTELPALEAVPHAHDPGAGYDGAFYAQLALDPLLRDSRIGLALDNAPYRGHRIVFSWTAYVLGLGRPAWILEVFALQNVIAWLIVAWWLNGRIGASDPRRFALWSGVLLGCGFLISVRYALTDGPAAMLLIAAIVATEGRRHLTGATVLSAAALGRETSLFAAPAFVLTRPRREWPSASLRLALVAGTPLAVWYAYLFSLYGWQIADGFGNLGMPLKGFVWKIGDLISSATRAGLTADVVWNLSAVLALVTQVIWTIAYVLPQRDKSAWAWVSLSFVVLAILAREGVWGQTPGAYPRVLLPLSLSTAVLMAQQPRLSWAWIVGANVGVIPGVALLVTGHL